MFYCGWTGTVSSRDKERVKGEGDSQPERHCQMSSLLFPVEHSPTSTCR